jgi:hypothetical protein
MDSLDLVEVVMLLEEFFDVEFPSNDLEGFGSPRDIVEWLWQRLSDQRPSQQAASALRKLAQEQQWPELAEGLDGRWRREQIAALVREVFKSQDTFPTSRR